MINSHSHAEHWLGNACFTGSGTEIIASGRAMTTMKEDGQVDVDVDAFSHMTKGATGSTHIVYPTSLLVQGEKRNLGKWILNSQRIAEATCGNNKVFTHR